MRQHALPVCISLQKFGIIVFLYECFGSWKMSQPQMHITHPTETCCPLYSYSCTFRSSLICLLTALVRLMRWHVELNLTCRCYTSEPPSESTIHVCGIQNESITFFVQCYAGFILCINWRNAALSDAVTRPKLHDFGARRLSKPWPTSWNKMFLISEKLPPLWMS